MERWERASLVGQKDLAVVDWNAVAIHRLVRSEQIKEGIHDSKHAKGTICWTGRAVGSWGDGRLKG